LCEGRTPAGRERARDGKDRVHVRQECRHSFDELELGGGVTLTAEEAEHYFETGDLPKRDV